MQICCPVVELRQYTLRPGQRDVLIDLFEREFIESQEATGMRIIGTFRDLNHPNTFPRLPVREGVKVFVWFSLFPDRAAWEQHSAAFGNSIHEREISGKLSRLIKEQPEIRCLHRRRVPYWRMIKQLP